MAHPPQPDAPENHMDDFEDEDEASNKPWPPRHALAALWEEDVVIRKTLRDNGKMLTWPKKALTGIATLSALSQNRAAINDALTVWASHETTPKSPPVEWLKDEVCDVQTLFSISDGFVIGRFLEQIISVVSNLFGNIWKKSQTKTDIVAKTQVKQLYVLVNVEVKPVNLYLDAWGVKRMISLCLRRWRSPINNFRDSWINIKVFPYDPQVLVCFFQGSDSSDMKTSYDNGLP